MNIHDMVSKLLDIHVENLGIGSQEEIDEIYLHYLKLVKENNASN